MQFDVTIQRTEYREHVFRVEAESRDAAYGAGLRASYDYDFSDSREVEASEDVISIEPVMAGKRHRRPTAGGPHQSRSQPGDRA